MIILLFDGYFQFFTGKNTFGYTSIRPDRLGGLFFDELILGSYISKMLPILITFAFLNKEIIHRHYIILLIILSYGLVFLSGERSAFLTTTLYLVMITPFLIGIKKTTTLFILITTIFILLISTNKNIKSRYVDQMLIHVIGHPKAKVFMPDHIGIFTSAIDIFKKKCFYCGGVKNI